MDHSGDSLPIFYLEVGPFFPRHCVRACGEYMETIFTTQHVRLSPSTVGCGTHAGEVQRVAQHGVHPAEDVRVAAGGEGRRLEVGVLQPTGVGSLRGEEGTQYMETSKEIIK